MTTIVTIPAMLFQGSNSIPRSTNLYHLSLYTQSLSKATYIYISFTHFIPACTLYQSTVSR